MEEVIIALQHPIDVAIDGAAISCDEVVLRPPTGRVQSQVQRIHQLIADSISSNLANSDSAKTENRDKSDTDTGSGSTMDGDTVISLLSLGGNLGSASKLLSEVFDAGYATIGGQTLKRPLRENMLMLDLEAIESAYLGNFTLPSWMTQAG